MFTHNLKIALRQIWKNKVQYVLSVFGIVLGLVVFSMVNYYLRIGLVSTYTVWENSGQMATVLTKSKITGETYGYLSGAQIRSLITNPVAGVEETAFSYELHPSLVTFTKEDGSEVVLKLPITKINRDYVDVFSLSLIEGNKDQLEGNQIIITRSVAQKAFGDEDPIGRTFTTNTWSEPLFPFQLYTIMGVVDDPNWRTGNKEMIYFLMPDDYFNTISDDSDFFGSPITVLLNKGVSTKEITERIQAQYPQFDTDDSQLAVKSYSELMRDSNTLLLYSLMLLVGSLILISGMINFLKFSIQTFLARTHELGIRKTMGTTYGQLFRLLFTEISLVLLVVAALTLFTTPAFINLFYYLIPPGMIQSSLFEINVDALLQEQVVYIAGLFIICILICLITVSRVRSYSIITSVNGGRKGKHGLRNFFLCFQLIVCCFFVGFTLIVNHIYKEETQNVVKTLTTKEMKHIWKLEMDGNMTQNKDAIVAQIKSLSSVEDVLEARSMFYHPFTMKLSNGKDLKVLEYGVAPNYPEFMHVPIEGRMPTQENELLMSYELRETLKREEVLDGNTITLNDKTYIITGFFDRIPYDTHPEAIIVPVKEYLVNPYYIKVYPEHAEQAKEQITEIVRQFLPETLPFEMIIYQDEYFREVGTSKSIENVFLLLSVFSVLITILGIYSAIALDTRQRRKEVAIRKINGASQSVIYRLFGRLYGWLLLISFVVTIPILLLLSQKMGNDDGLIGLIEVIEIIAIVSLIVFATVAWHIRKVSRLNPAEVIKSE